jgi:hypothetical protein
MATKTVSYGQARVVEVVGGIVCHAQALHDCHRSHVGRGSE